MDKVHESKEMDTADAGRGVWLVKVPNYLAVRWKNSNPGDTLGTFNFKQKVGASGMDVSLAIPKAQADKPTEDKAPCPSAYKMHVSGIKRQQLAVYSKEDLGPSAAESNGEFPDFKLKVEGYVNQRAECRPNYDDKYLELKLKQFAAKNKPKRKVEQLKGPKMDYKPVERHEAQRTFDVAKPEKRVRADKEVVMEKLFGAFEKHQYYNIGDLVSITRQPIAHLKEVLKEVCTYNMKAPHKNMWELKSEYRHYAEKEGHS